MARLKKLQMIWTLISILMMFTVAANSAQNGKIAFTSTRDGNYEIYVMNSDGSEQTRLTHNNTYDLYPDLSPDGRKIAFTGYKEDLTYAVFIMNSDGTGLMEIAPRSSNPRWSPDGRKLAVYGYSEIPGDNGVNIVDLDTGSVRHLVLGGSPIWSPDGSKIIFSERGSGGRLHSMNLDGTDLRRLQGGFGTEQALNSSGALNKILFSAEWWDASDVIFIANPDGTGRQHFHGSLVDYAVFADWSPDGESIIFASSDPPYTDTEIYVKKTDGTGLSRLTNTPGANFDPSWAPLRSDVSVSGKVTTPDGRGLRNATVTLTDWIGMTRTATTSSFGLYAFANVRAGETYTVSVSSKRYRFAPRTIQVDGNLLNVDLVGQE